MAEQKGMCNVTTTDEAVIWLWSAHNEVNQRLAGDTTEDPVFPKIQYPSQEACPQCYQQKKVPVQNVTPHWDTGEVLYYLRRAYSLVNLSRYGIDDGSVLSSSLWYSYYVNIATKRIHSVSVKKIDTNRKNYFL